jgi:hypothetical protein
LTKFHSPAHTLEIGFIWVEGGSEAKIFARLTALIKLIPLGFFVTAAVLTVMLEAKKTSIIPMYFCIGGWFAQELTYFFMFGFASADESNKGWVVPMNIPYLIHRYGEWTNLVLGESVLALLTSATSKDDYYIGYQFSFLAAFFMSLATVSSFPSCFNRLELMFSIIRPRYALLVCRSFCFNTSTSHLNLTIPKITHLIRYMDLGQLRSFFLLNSTLRLWYWLERASKC